ncbi:MAG: YggS family pyridoxal phosphate-dependent enzyme [Leptospirillia bacterium]
MSDFGARLTQIRERMARAARRAGRGPDEITLLAVSKTFSVPAIEEAISCGVTRFGESRVQEAEAKVDALGGHISWDMIGHLQRNKVARALSLFGLIHSLDSLRLAERINRLAIEQGQVQDVLVEVNVTADAARTGVLPEQAEALVREAVAYPGLRVRGLMGMAPHSPDPEHARPHFVKLASLRERIAQAVPAASMEVLSMGMSGDFEVAIEEGASLIRVGSALFGRRNAGER